MAVTRSKPRLNDKDEVQLRAFYAGCGFTTETIERAIKVRFEQPIEKKPAKDKHGRPKGQHLTTEINSAESD
jgi:hypothetical protein